MQYLTKNTPASSSLSSQQQQLVAIITTLTRPDMIFQLAELQQYQKHQSIFHSEPQTSVESSHRFLFIIINDAGERAIHEWQDMLEQQCQIIVPVTILLIQRATFLPWLEEGRRFALHVCLKADCLYDAGNIPVHHITGKEEKLTREDLLSIINRGLHRAQEFLAGAELFAIRQHHGLAAFMLHQTIEQLLRALVKAGTGFSSQTHSLDRLIKYASLVSPEVTAIFPKMTARDKQNFNSLQQAYIHARYKAGFKVKAEVICNLTEKAKELVKVVKGYEPSACFL